jgi:hypothetical protein
MHNMTTNGVKEPAPQPVMLLSQSSARRQIKSSPYPSPPSPLPLHHAPINHPPRRLHRHSHPRHNGAGSGISNLTRPTDTPQHTVQCTPDRILPAPMGLCVSLGGTSSGEAARAAAPSCKCGTALVLMPSGDMREYPFPATTAARVLEDASAAAPGDGWLLCDADGMGFEGPAPPAVPHAEPLRAGQLYFVLPAAARRRGLRREEVAALAVRASAALSSRASASASAAPGRRRRGAVAPLVFAPPPEDEEREQHKTTALAAAPVRRPARPGGRRLVRFASDLTAIPE